MWDACVMGEQPQYARLVEGKRDQAAGDVEEAKAAHKVVGDNQEKAYGKQTNDSGHLFPTWSVAAATWVARHYRQVFIAT